MKLTSKQIAQTGILLALCIASQFFKTLSVWITGPVVNTIIILAVLAVGLFSGIIISIIAPITAFIITSSPIIAAIPLIMPMIMIGNCILALCVWAFENKLKFRGKLVTGMLVGSVLKSLFMGISIVGILFSLFGSSLNEKQLAVGKITFTSTQLFTALIGSLLACIIWLALRKFLHRENS